MVEEVKGYLTATGVFFVNKSDARMYELKKHFEGVIARKASIDSSVSLDQQTFLSLIERMPSEVEEYCTLYKACNHEEKADDSSSQQD